MHPHCSESEAYILGRVRDGSIGITTEGQVVRLIDLRSNLALDPPKRIEILNGDGYLGVVLTSGGRTYSAKAHRLVYLHLVGPIPAGLEINHKNGNKADNRPDNIEAVTRSENIRHAFRIGLNNATRGEKHHLARLSDAQATEIRRAYAAGGVTQAELAARYGVRQSSIQLLVTGRSRRGHAGPTYTPATRTPLTDAQRSEAIKLWDSGLRNKQAIADRLGVRRTTVGAYFKRLGIVS